MASNNLSITMFNKICRICLKEEQLLTSLYDENNVLNLVENLETCTLVQFTKHDGLPEKICSQCINELYQSYNFALKCKTNDTLLRKCFISYHNSVLQKINDTEPELITNGNTTDYTLYDIPISVDNIKTENVQQSDTTLIVPLNLCGTILEEPNENEDLLELPMIETINETNSVEYSLRNRSNKNVDYNEAVTLDNNEPLRSKKKKSNSKKKRIFKCKTCLKTFHNSGNLNAHYRIHTGEKPYQCDVCLKTFNLSNNLTKHKRVHTGERLYKCQICEKTFMYSQDLKKHLKHHHN